MPHKPGSEEQRIKKNQQTTPLAGSMDVDVNNSGSTPPGATAPANAPSTNSAQLKELHGGELGVGGLSEEEIRLRTGLLKGSWSLHEQFGIPVCVSLLRAVACNDAAGGTSENEQCKVCKAFLDHIGAGVINNDRSLTASFQLRDLLRSRNAVAENVATMAAELAVMRRTLDDVSARNDTLQRELLDSTARRMVAETDRERLADSLEVSQNRERELISQIDRIDDNRARKRHTGSPRKPHGRCLRCL
ncbi:hypothetical protein R3P38DRAFT_3102545 [Favolaschia claudopus]|uniref:Uncharacterized protein n=1 Tax=Favolaschia claudopus TaxID=2862362 RepID=A0AAV9ZLC8_9AGAR